jgi:hypothetical protein
MRSDSYPKKMKNGVHAKRRVFRPHRTDQHALAAPSCFVPFVQAKVIFVRHRRDGCRPHR